MVYQLKSSQCLPVTTYICDTVNVQCTGLCGYSKKHLPGEGCHIVKHKVDQGIHRTLGIWGLAEVP